MQAKARRVVRSPQLTLWTLVLAVLTFNNWWLAYFFNRRLLLSGGAVSEFSAMSQPHAILFRSLDVVSGVLFVIAALLVMRHLAAGRSRLHLVLVGATAVFGIANSLDALLPLHCSETMSSTCSLTVHLSLTHPTIPSHGYSSGLIAAFYLLLPLLGFLVGRTLKLRTYQTISLVVVSIAMLSLGSAVANFLLTQSWSLRAAGPSQELQMVAFSLWFVASYTTLLTRRPQLVLSPVRS